MNEEVLEVYEALKRNRNIISRINPDFFFKIVDCLLKENEEKTTILLAGAEKVKQLEKENEELKDFKKQVTDIESTNFIKYKNYIPVQKVEDKIEKEIKYHEKNILDIENITMLKSKTVKEEAEIEFNKYAIVVLRKISQELLEGGQS